MTGAPSALWTGKTIHVRTCAIRFFRFRIPSRYRSGRSGSRVAVLVPLQLILTHKKKQGKNDEFCLCLL